MSQVLQLRLNGAQNRVPFNGLQLKAMLVGRFAQKEKRMDLEQAISELRARNEKVPKPKTLPTEEEIMKIENQYEICFPKEYMKYLLEASDVVFGTIEPATITDKNSHTYLGRLLRTAEVYKIPNEFIPICEDNANLFCINQTGQVLYWSHDSKCFTDEIWNSLSVWIQKVWIEENS